MKIIAGKMSALYKGRIEAELSLGDAVLFIREQPEGDGSVVLLDSTSGLQPRNWMPANSIHKKTLGGYVFTFPPRGEILEVFIEEIYEEIIVPSEIKTTLHKMGAEKEKADLLASCLEIISNKLTFIQREFPTSSGPIDIFAEDKDTGEPVVIEVKRRKANGASDLYQLKRYMYRIRKDKVSNISPRGILVAPAATKGLLRDIEEEPEIEFIRLSFKDIEAYIRKKM